MDLEIVNPQPKYAKVTLIQPPPLGYLHVAAAVDPPRWRTPFPARSPQKAALLTRLRSLAPVGAPWHRREGHRLPRRPGRAARRHRQAAGDPPRPLRRRRAHRDDSPAVLGEVQTAEPCKLLVEAVTEAATDVHVMTARCPKGVGDVDMTRHGLFLFNYFVADDAAVALQLWDYLAGWYAVETGLDNSTLLEPLRDADYVFVNHARWDYSLPHFLLRQLTKPSFRTYLLATCRPTGPAQCRSCTGSPDRRSPSLADPRVTM
jgi:hypothetical protein